MAAVSAAQLVAGSVLFVAAAGSVLALARLAPRLGWLDAPSGADAARKLQAAPVPPVAGAAILLAWIAVAAWAPERVFPTAHPLLAGEVDVGHLRWAAALALGAAFALGTADDLRRGGLAPTVKLAGQLGAGALLALPAWLQSGPGAEAFGATLLCAFCGAAAANALNTFDNADGVASGTAAVGLFAAGAGLLGAAVAGVVPAGLLRRRRGSATPIAYLGDGGSHLLALALLIVPGAWPALGLAFLDLARVALERLRAGQPPWRGDRRHLAHRLQRRGLGPLAVAATLWSVAALPLLVRGPWGWVLLVAAFLALVRSSTSPRADAWKSPPGPG